ncbi:MAG: hypothetical protein NDJ90_12385 [Oligoflexia bacterium]|nr:hypothetical protein [Oligoflexia bacterium]
MRALLPVSLLLAVAILSACENSEGQNQTAPQQPGTTPASLCEERTQALEREYDRLRSCDSDDQCNYIEGFYAVVPREETGKMIRVFDCKEVRPFLGVANGEEVTRGLEPLEILAEEQAQACARPPGTFICQAFSEVPSSPPPVCREGRCETVPY